MIGLVVVVGAGEANLFGQCVHGDSLNGFVR